MRLSARASRRPLVVVGFLVVLLAVLASLQYRWIAQLSEAERTRLQESLNQAAAEFCEDFDREVARAFVVFNLGETEEGAELSRLLDGRLREWKSTATWPDLVQDLVVIRRRTANDVVPLCFDEKSQQLLQCDLGDRLQPIRHALGGPRRGLPATDGAVPGLVMAIQERRTSSTEGPFEWRPPRDHLVVRFDLGFIRDTLLPQLAESYFPSNDGRSFSLAVIVVDRPEQIIFQTGSLTPPRGAKPDAAEPLFGLRPISDISDPPVADPHSSRHPPPRQRPQGKIQRRQEKSPPHGPAQLAETARWVLAVHHPAGSLEDAVATARRRNMMISLATLTMLGATALLMLLSTRRAQRLARQQMDFVATISHELRTPLTAIRSAGQNLADGIIAEPSKVRSYGLLIEREGRRLTEMIGRVLTFAGIRSGREAFRMEIVDLPGIVEAAVADCRWTLKEKGIEVDSRIESDFPPVKGDAGALRLVINNLIDNGIKYGGSGRWLGVRGGFDPDNGPGEVWISIADRGPGIPRRERKLVFEPFRRGADAASGTVPGSGLGLAVVRGVVEAHGGRIEVSSSSGKGTTFTLHLPAMPVVSVQERGR